MCLSRLGNWGSRRHHVSVRQQRPRPGTVNFTEFVGSEVGRKASRVEPARRALETGLARAGPPENPGPEEIHQQGPSSRTRRPPSTKHTTASACQVTQTLLWTSGHHIALHHTRLPHPRTRAAFRTRLQQDPGRRMHAAHPSHAVSSHPSTASHASGTNLGLPRLSLCHSSVSLFRRHAARRSPSVTLRRPSRWGSQWGPVRTWHVSEAPGTPVSGLTTNSVA